MNSRTRLSAPICLAFSLLFVCGLTAHLPASAQTGGAPLDGERLGEDAFGGSASGSASGSVSGGASGGALAGHTQHYTHATRPDTTWITTYDHDFYNWATPHVETFEFPPEWMQWSQILLEYTIGCPTETGDCDPWDRLGHLRVVEIDSTGAEIHTEIARVITPYDITGGTRPDSCTFVLDVTDYESLLHDSVTLSNYIESWMGNEYGWVVTIRFGFIPGTNELEAFRVENLWQYGHLVYGDPANPIESYLNPQIVEIPSEAVAVKFRAITTGHGQGNTDNAAEFSYKWHEIVTNGVPDGHYLWRDDCPQNTCSPQGGTWPYNRAGWCPGDKVDPWDVDVTGWVTPGEPAEFDYNVEEYENYCRPNNPDCIPGVTCADCNYNYTGHTEPHYTIQGQVIFYRPRSMASIPEGDFPNGGVREAAQREWLELHQNRPNPFRGGDRATTFRYSIASAGDVTVRILSPEGRCLQEETRRHDAAGTFSFTWDGTDGSGRRVPAGAYFYEVQGPADSHTRKMLLLR